MRLSDAEHALVTAAVTEAERATSGEIVAIVTARSDTYGDVAAHWAVIAMLSVLTLLAIRPSLAEWFYFATSNAWVPTVPAGDLFLVALLLLSATFVLARIVLAITPIRLLLTPETTKARRVHRRALELFRAAVEQRTRAATGVLLYVSLAERRAEIVADHAIHSHVEQAVWGEAMHLLVEAIRDGRAGEGVARAIERVGAVLAEHFPRDGADRNELPDRLIEL